jgi:methionyl-tRNA formyltransferase
LSDGEINFSQAAVVVSALIRGVTPEPGAFTTVDGVRLKLVDTVIARDCPILAPGVMALVGKMVLVGTATDPIRLLTVHPAGRKQMDAGSWWHGRGPLSDSSVTGSTNA